MNSIEELSDVYAHFTLYYGKDLVAMRNRQARKAAVDDLDAMDTSLDGSQVKIGCQLFDNHKYQRTCTVHVCIMLRIKYKISVIHD